MTPDRLFVAHLAALCAFIGAVISIGFVWACVMRWWTARAEAKDVEAELLCRERAELAHKQRLTKAEKEGFR